MNRASIIVVAVLVLFSYCYESKITIARIPSPSIPQKSSSFDYFLMVERWPMTFCNTKKCGSSSEYDNAFTIHGLWPNNNDGSYPSFCNNSNPFDIDKVEPIEDELAYNWPDLVDPSSPSSFWAHEWDKHGTCAQTIADTSDELKYFEKSLNLKSKLSFLDLLSDAGIKPDSSKEYKRDNVVQAISKGIGADPLVTCQYEGGKDLIDSIYVCVSKQFEFFECNSEITQNFQGKNCRTDSVVILPFP